ncbi:hypothetical protein C8J56DRAFT_1157645 [Mycena floridula]|nr:hypothetical protein C8J56DRAFT_1157645 [Mycena floridula]
MEDFSPHEFSAEDFSSMPDYSPHASMHSMEEYSEQSQEQISSQEQFEQHPQEQPTSYSTGTTPIPYSTTTTPIYSMPPTPTMPFPTTVHLEQEIVQATRTVPSQNSPIDNTPIRLHPVPQLSRGSSGRVALTRTSAVRSRTPYERPVADPSTPEPIVRFMRPETTLRPATFTASSSGTPHSSPLATGRPTELPASTPPLPAPAPRRVRYSIRMDSHYDPTTGVFSAAMELPGVRKRDLKVVLSTCTWNSVRHICVFGTVRPYEDGITAPFSSAVSGSSASTSATVSAPSDPQPSGSSIIQIPVRERKYGDYTRNVVVPSGTMPADVDAHLKDGLLMLKIRCGEPAASTERCEVPVR